MVLDPKWLDALQLPFKIKVAIALASSVLLYLFKNDALSLGTLDPYIRTGLCIGLVLSLIFAAVDIVEWCAKPLFEKRHVSVMAARRAVRRNERQEARAIGQMAVLARLDHLSREEIRYVAEALEKNTPTFYTYIHSPAVGIMQGKNLVWTDGGSHHQDHYPFSFHDFVWSELLARRDEFLAKEQTHRRADDAAMEAARRRPWR